MNTEVSVCIGDEVWVSGGVADPGPHQAVTKGGSPESGVKDMEALVRGEP